LLDSIAVFPGVPHVRVSLVAALSTMGDKVLPCDDYAEFKRTLQELRVIDDKVMQCGCASRRACPPATGHSLSSW